MAKKLGNLSVKTGEYTKDGATKGRYENIGVLWEGDSGMYITLKRTFNPAGAPFKDGSDAIMVSVFADREDKAAPREQATETTSAFVEDSIPF